MRNVTLLVIFVFVGAACAPSSHEDTSDKRVWTMEDAVIFPDERSLQRPEDGVILEDGALLVSDQRHGLVRISRDGTVRSFGNFAAAGYRYEPPANNAGPNGVTLEPAGTHVLVADVFAGAIYRVDIRNETTEKIYQHDYGVNTARRDSTGAIWFTQSTENSKSNAEERLFAAVDFPTPDGALFRIAPYPEGAQQPTPEVKVSGLNFANGFAIDEADGAFYLSETMSDRVLGFALDVETGVLSDQRVVANVLTPDNMELHASGQLWVASPLGAQIVTVDVDSGAVAPVFLPENEHRSRLMDEWRRRGEAGESRLDLLGPDLIGSMPVLITGVILPVNDIGPFYVTGLGDAIVKLGVDR